MKNKKKKKSKIYNNKLKEKCGVFGISNSNDASTLTALGLHALQHRGQEGCGIVSFDGKNYHSEKRFGLVGDNFNKEKVLKKLPGDYAIGHNRYSTTGGTTLRNVQPFFADTNAGGIVVAHNGNLTNAITLRNKLVKDGAIFYSTSDTETIIQLIAKSKREKKIDKIIDALFQIQGAYALVFLTQNTLIGVRDPFGIRPLVIGKLNNSYILASETCALDIIGAKFVREVDNGEIVIIENNELKSIKPFPLKKQRPCVFEYIYFARPDSILNGKCAYEYRKDFGKELAKESDIEADLIVPVPDSGNAAAIGYSQHIKGKFDLGLYYEIKKYLLSLNTSNIFVEDSFRDAITPKYISHKIPELNLELRDYQRVIVDACLRIGRGVCVLATAGGKTLTIASLIENVFQKTIVPSQIGVI